MIYTQIPYLLNTYICSCYRSHNTQKNGYSRVHQTNIRLDNDENGYAICIFCIGCVLSWPNVCWPNRMRCERISRRKSKQPCSSAHDQYIKLGTLRTLNKHSLVIACPQLTKTHIQREIHIMLSTSFVLPLCFSLFRINTNSTVWYVLQMFDESGISISVAILSDYLFVPALDFDERSKTLELTKIHGQISLLRNVVFPGVLR